MKSNWKILTLVGTLLTFPYHGVLGQGTGPENAPSVGGDFYSSRVDDRETDRYTLRVGELNGPVARSQTAVVGAGVGAEGSRSSAVSGQGEPTDAMRYVLQLDDRGGQTRSPNPAAPTIPLNRSEGGGGAAVPVVVGPLKESELRTREIEPIADPLTQFEPESSGAWSQFASLSRSLLDAPGESFLDSVKGKGGKPYCNCPACSRGALFQRTFASVEFSHLWTKSRSVPPLVTTDLATTPINSGPPNFTPIALTLNSPTAQILMGEQPLGGDRQAGGKVDIGWWLDPCRTQAIGLAAYGSEGAAALGNFLSNGSTPLGRPFYNTDPFVDDNDALIVAHPLLNRGGSVGVRNGNDFLGAEAYYRTLLDSHHDYRIELLAGYRFNRIDDDLMIDTGIRDVFGNQFYFLDLFDTNNTYHAGDLGLYGEFGRGPLTLSLLGKIGAGNMNQRVAIRGFNAINNAPSTPGGLLTQPTNIGVYERDVLVWSPEANVRLAYALTNHMSLTVGYTFMYWTAVAMAGDQVDFNVNATQLTGGTLQGPADPQFRFHNTDFWVQSLDVGFTWNY